MDMIRPTKSTETDKYNHRKDTAEGNNDVTTATITADRRYSSGNHAFQASVGGIDNIWNYFSTIKTTMTNGSTNERKKMYVTFLVLLFVACVVSVSTENNSFRKDLYSGDDSFVARKVGGGAERYSMAATSRGYATTAAAPPEMMNLEDVDSAAAAPMEDESSVNDKDYARDKMLVYRGSVTIETLKEDMETLADGIISICQGKGNGYIESDERTKYSISLNLRVSSTEYQSIVKSIKTTVDDVEKAEILRSSTSIRDVTADYVDSSSRAATILASREAMTLLLEKATTVEDILRVRRELDSLTQEYESKKSRANYLKNQADLSYMTVHLQATDEYADPDGEPWDPLVPFWKACEHMTFLGLFAVNVTIYALVWAIPCVIAASVLSLLFRRGR